MGDYVITLQLAGLCPFGAVFWPAQILTFILMWWHPYVSFLDQRMVIATNFPVFAAYFDPYCYLFNIHRFASISCLFLPAIHIPATQTLLFMAELPYQCYLHAYSCCLNSSFRVAPAHYNPPCGVLGAQCCGTGRWREWDGLPTGGSRTESGSLWTFQSGKMDDKQQEYFW